MEHLIELIVKYCQITNFKIERNTLELNDIFNHALQLGHLDGNMYKVILQTLEDLSCK